MNAFLLITIILCLAIYHVSIKAFNTKCTTGVYTFSILTSLSCALFFTLTGGNLSFSSSLIPHAAAFAVSYAAATVGNVIAIGCGSLSLTTLIISYSLMLPTVYGLFLGDPIKFGFYPGLALLLISLLLINKKGEKTPINGKWVISVLVSFVGNGMCSIVQKHQQDTFDGGKKHEFMIVSLLFVALILFVFMLIKERKDLKTCIRHGWLWGIICGITNGIVNLLVMVLGGGEIPRIPVSVMFPLISAGGIVVTFIMSKLIYKEEMSKKQLLGFVLGIASVVFLNL